MAELLTMYPGQANSPETTLAGSLTSSGTTATVLDGSVLPAAPNYLTIGGDTSSAETVLMTAKDGNTITIQRGQNGTAPRVWEKGDIVGRYFTAADHDALIENINRLNNAKAEKVQSGATGNFAAVGAGGNITDSGKKPADFANANHTHTDKADKVTGATVGNFAGLDESGNITDSGSKAGDFAAANHSHSGYALVKFFTNVSVPASAWQSSTAKPSYPYAASITAAGVDSTWKPKVIFSDNDAESGNFSTSADTGAGVVVIYAASAPGDITIPTIECIKAVN